MRPNKSKSLIKISSSVGTKIDRLRLISSIALLYVSEGINMCVIITLAVHQLIIINKNWWEKFSNILTEHGSYKLHLNFLLTAICETKSKQGMKKFYVNITSFMFRKAKNAIKRSKYLTIMLCNFICCTMKIKEQKLIIHRYNITWTKTLNVKHDV